MPSVKEHLKAMAGTIDSIRYYPSRSVFTDFVEMAAICIRNAYDMKGHGDREAVYLKLIQKYKPEDHAVFATLLKQLTCALSDHPADILGELYMNLGLANEKRGQFFTPPSISDLLSRLAINPDQVRSEVAQRGFITLSEPSCGSGAMVIAFASNLLDLGINYQQHLHVTLVDLDVRAVHMAFIQLSLLHIPAIVVHGNTLTLEEFSHWETPAHGMNLFHLKLKRGFAIDSSLGEAFIRGVDPKLADNEMELALLPTLNQTETSLQGLAL